MNSLDTPTWVKYAGDLFFLILFLVFFFFFKPSGHAEDEWEKDNEENAGDAPNPLEQMLISEDDQDDSHSEAGIAGEPPAKEESRSDI